MKGFQGPDGTWFVYILHQESGYAHLGARFPSLPDGDHYGTPSEEGDWPYGTGILATVTFNCKKAGECVLGLYDTLLEDIDAHWISHQVEDGYVTVPSAASVDLNSDGIINIVDIVTVALAFGAERIEDPEDPRYGEYWHDPPCPNCPHH